MFSQLIQFGVLFQISILKRLEKMMFVYCRLVVIRVLLSWQVCVMVICVVVVVKFIMSISSVLIQEWLCYSGIWFVIMLLIRLVNMLVVEKQNIMWYFGFFSNFSLCICRQISVDSIFEVSEIVLFSNCLVLSDGCISSVILRKFSVIVLVRFYLNFLWFCYQLVMNSIIVIQIEDMQFSVVVVVIGSRLKEQNYIYSEIMFILL